MSSQFEKDIQDIVGNYKMKADPNLWKQIEPQLPTEKKRRKAIIWWTFAAVVLVGGSILMYNNQDSSKSLIPESNISNGMTFREPGVSGNEPSVTQHNKNSNIATAPLLETVMENPQSITEAKGVTASENKNRKEIFASKNAITQYPEKEILRADKTSDQLLNALVGKSIPLIAKQDFEKENFRNGEIKRLYNQVLENNHIESDPLKNEYDTLLAAETPIIDSLLDFAVKDSFNKQVSVYDTLLAINSIDSTTKKELKVAVGKKSWKLYGGLGLSNTSNLITITNGSGRNYLDFSSAPNSGGGSYNNNYSYGRVSKPKTAISFQVGIQKTFIINQYLEWYAGANLLYLSNFQERGLSKDSTFESSQNTIRSIFRGGSSAKEKNYNASLGMQLGINYIINPKSKNPFYINAGLMPVYSIAQKQIHISNTATFLFYNKNLDTRFNLATDAGINWQFTSKSAISLQAQLFMLSNTKSTNNSVMANKWKMLHIKYTYSL